MGEGPIVAEQPGSQRFDVDSLVATVVASGAIPQVSAARLVTDGLQHVVLVLDDRFVARFPRDEAAAAALRDEASLLEVLAERVTAPLPVPIHVDESFTVHRMLQGSDTSRAALARLDPRARARLIDDVGRFLSELSATTIPDLVPSAATTSVDRLLDLRRRLEARVIPQMWRHQRVWLEEVFDAVERISFDHEPSVIHGDLAPYHVLHDPESGRLTGVLDFGSAGVGDPAVDLACLLTVWGERYANELVRTWPTACELADRARLVAMTLPLEWAVAALETGSPDLAVAHLGHLAVDVGEPGTPFGQVEPWTPGQQEAAIP